MIRILHFAGIINRYDIIDTVLTRLDRSKYEVFALTGMPSRQQVPYTNGEHYKTRCLGMRFERRLYPQMFRELSEEIRRIQPHIIQAHHYDENIIASMAVRMAGTPCYIIGRHYSDHIYYLTRGLKRRFFLAGEAFCNRTATKITVPAQSVAQLLIERQGVPARKVKVIPFGLDFDKYRPSSPEAPLRLRREYGLEGKYLALVCCRLNPEKGIEYLLQAVPEIRSANQDFRLTIVGSGAYEDELRRRGRELGIEDTVRFVGWRDDALDWIAAADVVVQPSFCESFCQVLFEALAFARPVVMTPVGAAPDAIGDNERGRLVPPGDSRAIAAAICEIMSNRDLANRLGEKGREYVYSNMGADITTRRYERLYEEALGAVS
ncbi:MAG TPA: glycosyltransferase family 4 protein [Blastocatellia bacterium]|nr:glycosyltransferase family 4 protein [Blastocatellia bacterium]